MKVVALVGLVSIEKIQLVIDLATHYTWNTDKTVTIIDNVARLAIDPVQLSDEPLIRVNDDLTEGLTDRIRDINSDIVLIAVSESAELDKLFISLDIMTEQLPHIDLLTVGLVDLRTCDCFPHIREKLEDYADVYFLAPFEVNEIRGVINGTH
jgi:hypothetical protein